MTPYYRNQFNVLVVDTIFVVGLVTVGSAVLVGLLFGLVLLAKIVGAIGAGILGLGCISIMVVDWIAWFANKKADEIREEEYKRARLGN